MSKKILLTITLVLLMSAPLALADNNDQRGAGIENIALWLLDLFGGGAMDPNGIGAGIDPNGLAAGAELDPHGIAEDLDSRGTMDPDGANAAAGDRGAAIDPNG